MKKLTAIIMLATLLCLASCGGTSDLKDETMVINAPADITADVTTEAPDTTEAEEAIGTERIVETLENFDEVITIKNKKTGEPILITVFSADGVYKTEYYYEHVFGENLVVRELTYLRKSEFIEKDYLAQELQYEYNVNHQKIAIVAKAYLSSGTVLSDSKITLHENGKYKTMDTVYTFPNDNVKREVEEFDESGKLIKTTKYDENGNIIK